jgi:hypothetical protein
MLYREIIAVCSQVPTKHINTLCGQNVGFGLWGPRRFLLNVHRGSSPGIQRLGCEVDEFPPSSAVVRNKWSFTSTPPYMLAWNLEGLRLFRRFAQNCEKRLSASSCQSRLSVRMEKLRSHRTDFHEIWYLRIFRPFVEKIQDSLQSDSNNGYFI